MKTAFERLVAARPAAVQEPVDEALLDRITAYEPRPVRRPRRLVWAAGLAAVLVTAGAVAVVRGATPAATPPAPQRLTVVAHVEKAMSERDYIVRSTYGFSANNGQKVVWTTWSDAVTGKLRASSTVSGVRMDTLFDGDLTTVVSYRDRAWWQLRSTPTPEPTGGIRLEGPPRTPTEIKKALASGIFHVDEGKQPVVNGHRTIQLSSTRPDPVLGSFTIWVDAASYLPVRISASDDAKIRFVGADLEWLPRDSASLANLNLAIPPGFRHADKPVEPKPPADGGVG